MVELRVGVIGAGLIAQEQHLPYWQALPEAEIVAVSDVELNVARRVGQAFDAPLRVADYRRVLDDPRVNVVDICLPSALHAEAVIAALRHGKHVLCEKPMATSRAGAAAILTAARESGRKLMVVQNMRYFPSAAELKRNVDQLGLGHVYYARGQWLRRRRLPGRPGFTTKSLSGGGPLYDLGVHIVDLTWWLMGCPRPVTASGGVFDLLARRGGLGSEWGEWDPAAIDVEDFGAGLIRFENGALMSLEASWLGFQPEDEFWKVQLFGTQAGALWPNCRMFGERDGRPWNVQFAPPRGEKPHQALIRAFAQALLDDTPVPVPPEQSANTIAMLEALYQSAAQGREVSVETFPM